MPGKKEVKSVLNKSRRRDPWFLDDYTVNLYESCAFNCLYCYIRGSKYGQNLAHNLTVKTNAIEVLDRQLYNRAKKEQYGIVVLSSATDPYMKIEEEYQLTRQALELLLKYRFPVHVLTKSDGILRDYDLLHRIDEKAILPNDLAGKLSAGAIISFSFSTLRDQVGRIFEPGATPPSVRLSTVKQTLNEKFKTGISLMPLIPFISDTTEELTYAFSQFASIGVDYVMPATITLFGDEKADSKTLMLRALEKHYPHLVPKYRRFFIEGSQMPLYYRKAFEQKMAELAQMHQIPSRIVQLN